MELSSKPGNSNLLYCKQVVNFYYLDLEVVEQVVDWFFAGMMCMVIEVVDWKVEFDFKIVEKSLIEEDGMEINMG